MFKQSRSFVQQFQKKNKIYEEYLTGFFENYHKTWSQHIYNKYTNDDTWNYFFNA